MTIDSSLERALDMDDVVQENNIKNREKMRMRGQSRTTIFENGTVAYLFLKKEYRVNPVIKRIPCIIYHYNKFRCNYKIVTTAGMLARNQSPADLTAVENTAVLDPKTMNELRQNVLKADIGNLVKGVGLQAAVDAVMQLTGVRCSCRSKCMTNRCRCKKAKKKCTHHCHSGKSCSNGV